MDDDPKLQNLFIDFIFLLKIYYYYYCREISILFLNFIFIILGLKKNLRNNSMADELLRSFVLQIEDVGMAVS